MKARKQKEVEFCDDFDKAGKYIDNSIKNIRSFCQKGGATTELQNELGDYLKQLGLENDDELGETLVKLGDCLKSMATLNHVMLCNIEDNYLQPISEFRKDLSNNSDLSSVEHYAKKCIKQEEHMKQLLKFFMCFYHYYSEGYTLTFHLREPLEKIKDRSVKNVIAMRDQVMEELKPKKKPLPTPPTASISPNTNVSLKRQDSTLSGVQFKKAPPIPKHASSLSSNSEIKVSNGGYHTSQYSDSSVTSSISNRSSSSSSDESVEPMTSPRNIPVVTPRSIPKPTPKPPVKTQSPPTRDVIETPVVDSEQVVETTPITTWKKPVAPTIKRNDSFISQPIMESPPVVEPVRQPVLESKPIVESNNNLWKKPVAPTIKRNDSFISQPIVESPPIVEPVLESKPIVESNNSSWKKPVAPTIKRNDSFISQPVLESPPVVEPVRQPVLESKPIMESNNSWKKPIPPNLKKKEESNHETNTFVETQDIQPNNSGSSWKKPIAPNLNRNASFKRDVEQTSEESPSNSVSSFKKNLENSIQFRLPGMVNSTENTIKKVSPNQSPVSPSPSSENTQSSISKPISKPPIPQSRKQPTPSYLAKCKAIYPYTAQSGEELTFKPGDIVFIYEKEQEYGWWKGSLESDPEKKSFFPSNYVQIL